MKEYKYLIDVISFEYTINIRFVLSNASRFNL